MNQPRAIRIAPTTPGQSRNGLRGAEGLGSAVSGVASGAGSEVCVVDVGSSGVASLGFCSILMWINTFRSRRFVSFFCQGSVSDGKQVTRKKMVLSHLPCSPIPHFHQSVVAASPMESLRPLVYLPTLHDEAYVFKHANIV